LPFIDKSFKNSLHSLSGIVRIEIRISLLQGRLYLWVTNDHAGGDGKVQQEPGKGIANIQRQLDILYDKDYSLILDGTASKYKVYLTFPESTSKVA